MSEKIEPVLTAEGIAELDGYIDWDSGIIDVTLGGPAGSRDARRDRHALAALALYGQPFGFSREDVTQLRKRAANCRESERWAADQMYPDKIRDAREAAELYESLADRIEALLPPERSRTEITAFGDTRRQFREADGSITTEPFPQVDPYTGLFLPPEK